MKLWKIRLKKAAIFDEVKDRFEYVGIKLVWRTTATYLHCPDTGCQS